MQVWIRELVEEKRELLDEANRLMGEMMGRIHYLANQRRYLDLF